MDRREAAARALEAIARDLETAAAHCRVGATHFRDGEIPRAGAHQWAAHGHLARASRSLDRCAEEFASRSRPVISDEA
jgi:hypothetical protein